MTLTEHQLDVLTLVAAGHTNQAIATRLHVHEDTVKTHLTNVFRRLGAHNRAHAVALAYQHGHLPMPTGSTPRTYPPTNVMPTIADQIRAARA